MFIVYVSGLNKTYFYAFDRIDFWLNSSFVKLVKKALKPVKHNLVHAKASSLV